MKRTKFWIIIIATLFLVSMAASVGVYMFHGNGNSVSIYQNGNLLKRIHLDTVTTPYEFTIKADNGGYNVVSVEQGRICITDASCPDHVCVNTGWISDGAIPIVCLPNELVIQAESNEFDSIDGAAQ